MEKNAKIKSLKERVKRLLACGIGAVSLMALSGCGISYVDTCKNVKFDNLDSKRTLEQAFKENPFVKNTEWKVVNLGNGKGVKVSCKFGSGYILEELKKNKDKLDDEAEIQILYAAALLADSVEEASYIFSVDEIGGGKAEIDLKKVTFAPSKEKALAAAESVANQMKQIGINGDFMNAIQKRCVGELNSVNFAPIETDSIVIVGELLENIYKKEFPDFFSIRE